MSRKGTFDLYGSNLKEGRISNGLAVHVAAFSNEVVNATDSRAIVVNPGRGDDVFFRTSEPEMPSHIIVADTAVRTKRGRIGTCIREYSPEPPIGSTRVAPIERHRYGQPSSRFHRPYMPRYYRTPPLWERRNRDAEHQRQPQEKVSTAALTNRLGWYDAKEHDDIDNREASAMSSIWFVTRWFEEAKNIGMAKVDDKKAIIEAMCTAAVDSTNVDIVERHVRAFEMRLAAAILLGRTEFPFARFDIPIDGNVRRNPLGHPVVCSTWRNAFIEWVRKKGFIIRGWYDRSRSPSGKTSIVVVARFI